MLFTCDELIHFLLHAKRRNPVNRGSETPVVLLLPGSQQNEYYEAPFFYRSISFGTTCLVGLETVAFRERPAWSMSYSGGVISENVDPAERCLIYAFLHQALQLVTYERPFRGPQLYYQDAYRYLDSTQGDITRFRGEEIIMKGNRRVYELRYGGGILD